MISQTYLSAGLLAAAAVGGLLLAGCSPEHPASPAPAAPPANVTLTAAQQQNIHLATVALSNFHKTVDTTGTVDFDNDQATTMLAPMSGPVSRLLVSLGDQVKAGQPLAEVDSPDFATAITTYRKALATAKITLELAEQDQQLIEHHGISLREAEQARIDATNAAADADAALQQLVSLKVDPETIKAIQEGKAASPVQGLIRSPLAGTVVEKLITPGELLLTAATPCFTVADLSQVWVLADIYESDLASVALGDTAEVITSATTRSYPGVVDNICAIVDPNTRSIARARGGEKPRRHPQKANVCPRPHPFPKTNLRRAHSRLRRVARFREPAVCLSRPGRWQLPARPRPPRRPGGRSV